MRIIREEVTNPTGVESIALPTIGKAYKAKLTIFCLLGADRAILADDLSMASGHWVFCFVLLCICVRNKIRPKKKEKIT